MDCYEILYIYGPQNPTDFDDPLTLCCQQVDNLGNYWNVLASVGWTAAKFGADIHVQINFNDLMSE